MRPFHERLARIGLAATQQFGFVLAGGYAVSANGMGDRLSEDVDLFTNLPGTDDFSRAVDAVQDAYRRSGLEVAVVRRGPTFLDLIVSDAAEGESSSIQLGLDYREFPPAQLEIGPVLDVKDAVANKMTALYSRGECRDFIDIDLVHESGRFTRDEILALGDGREVEPMDRQVLAARFREAGRHSAARYAGYGVDDARRSLLVGRFEDWAWSLS